MPELAADVHAAFRAGPPARLERPLAIVHGNCQAEALRRLLPAAALTTVRIPPVHELTAADVAPLRRWLARAAALVVQPIRRGYRGLPVGTAEVIAAAGSARTVLMPVIRFAGLYPEQVIVRPAEDPAATPPLVPYHSLRTLAQADGRMLAPLRPAAVRAIAEASRAQLAAREARHGTIVVSDLFRSPDFAQMRTINHPGDPIWTEVAGRVGAALGLASDPGPPSRPLLDSIHAPREPAVIEAFGLSARPVGVWTVEGVEVDPAAVHAAHLRWYAQRPATVAAGLVRHRAALHAIGVR